MSYKNKLMLLLMEVGLERFGSNLEQELGITNVDQLFDEDVLHKLKLIGMQDCDIEKLIQALMNINNLNKNYGVPNNLKKNKHSKHSIEILDFKESKYHSNLTNDINVWLLKNKDYEKIYSNYNPQQGLKNFDNIAEAYYFQPNKYDSISELEKKRNESLSNSYCGTPSICSAADTASINSKNKSKVIVDKFTHIVKNKIKKPKEDNKNFKEEFKLMSASDEREFNKVIECLSRMSAANKDKSGPHSPLSPFLSKLNSPSNSQSKVVQKMLPTKSSKSSSKQNEASSMSEVSETTVITTNNDNVSLSSDQNDQYASNKNYKTNSKKKFLHNYKIVPYNIKYRQHKYCSKSELNHLSKNPLLAKPENDNKPKTVCSNNCDHYINSPNKDLIFNFDPDFYLHVSETEEETMRSQTPPLLPPRVAKTYYNNTLPSKKKHTNTLSRTSNSTSDKHDLTSLNSMNYFNPINLGALCISNDGVATCPFSYKDIYIASNSSDSTVHQASRGSSQSDEETSSKQSLHRQTYARQNSENIRSRLPSEAETKPFVSEGEISNRSSNYICYWQQLNDSSSAINTSQESGSNESGFLSYEDAMEEALDQISQTDMSVHLTKAALFKNAIPRQCDLTLYCNIPVNI